MAVVTIACAQCGTALPDGANFCFQCGLPIGRVDHGSRERLGARSVADRRSYTPRHLAEKILISRTALHGERKQVTVLFADVKESMELAGRVDPETWHTILDRFFAILCEGIHRFEGTVNQFTGDGIMALFGAPIAHEDHAQRAGHAALYLSSALRRYSDELRLTQELNFAVRMGLNAGEVVVGAIGDDLRMDYTAQGQTVGLAARMEQIAEPGRIYVTDHVVRLTRGFFRFRDLGLLGVKGVVEPVHVHELEGVGPLRTRLDASRLRGFSRFVGRAAEMEKLEGALARASAGRGCVVGIVAEAGVGKSRLCHELAEHCRARGMTVREAHAVSHGRMIPFLPVLELLRGYFGIREEDDANEARKKIAGTLLLIDRELDRSLPLVFDFLGVPDPEQPSRNIDPEARQRHLFAVVKELVRATSRREPSIILFEDLHWIDGASAAVLDNLVDAVTQSPTLLVVNFRPGYEAAWTQRAEYEAIALRPLGPTAARELLHDLLGTHASLGNLADRIRDRTLGNPFFIEETVQSLVEGGQLAGAKGTYRLVVPVTDAEIPATVQATLAARIDRLPEGAKTVLQVAAVIGKRFSEPVLRWVLTASASDIPFSAPKPESGGGPSPDSSDLAAVLRSLADAELIYEESVYPEAEYAFKHPLTREVAYRSPLTDQRRLVHRTVAHVLEQLHVDRPDPVAALLAHHWEGAGERLLAAEWSRRAAEWAGRSDVVEAVRHWRRVQELIQGDESRASVGLGIWAHLRLLNLGWRIGLSDREAAKLFADGKVLTEQADRTDALIGLMNIYGIVKGMAGDVPGALRYVTEATRLADESGDLALRVASRLALSQARYMNGALAEALMGIDEALVLVAEDPEIGAFETGLSPYAFLLMYRGGVLVDIGPSDEAAEALDHAIEVARELGEDEVLGWAHDFSAHLAQHSSQPATALSHAYQAIEMAERFGNSFSRAAAYYALGIVRVRLEDWAPAAETLEAALALLHERRTAMHMQPAILARLAEAQLGLGDADKARVTAREAVALGQRRGTRFNECIACVSLARVLRQIDAHAWRDDIESALTRAAALIEQTGTRMWIPMVEAERDLVRRET